MSSTAPLHLTLSDVSQGYPSFERLYLTKDLSYALYFKVQEVLLCSIYSECVIDFDLGWP